MIKALKNFHPYVYGRVMLLRTDNASVSWRKSLRDSTGQVARWLQTLGTYDVNVTHIPGRKHTNTDALFRYPCRSCKRREDINQVDQKEGEKADNPYELQSKCQIGGRTP